MQMLLSHTGGEIVSRTEIGMIPITLTARGRKDALTRGKEYFSGYALHQYTVIQTRIWHVLARSEKAAHIVRHDTYPWYGVLFHPEVRNEWIIERFVTEIQL
jgi:GMP synthase (glutamine-hydrolysing)